MDASTNHFFKLLIAMFVIVGTLSCSKEEPEPEDEPEDETTGTFTDERDGNEYAWIKIGDQTWMAENLAYLPEVDPPTNYSYKDPYFYVYDYNGNDVEAAKSTSNYQTYGVLYNWTAVMSGEESSNQMPSEVQGVCPDNWHIPSEDEFTKLILFLYASGFEYDVDHPASLAKSLASTTFWETGFEDGDVGINPELNNISGFNGLPAGTTSNTEDGVFYGLYKSASWWGCSELDNSYADKMGLSYRGTTISHGKSLKFSGKSVRCIKD